MLAWIYCTLVATINQRQTLVATINKRDNLIKISLYKRQNPVMTILLNQGKYPNLIHIYLNKREHQIMTLPINKREHIQTLLYLSITNRDKGTQLSMVMRIPTTTIYLHHRVGIHALHIHDQLGTHVQHISRIWINYPRTQKTPRAESEDHPERNRILLSSLCPCPPFSRIHSQRMKEKQVIELLGKD